MPVSTVLKDSLAKKIAGEVVFSDKPGTTLRKWRDILNITQTEIAEKLSISPSVISDYEAGRRIPGSKFVRRFVATLISIDEERGGRHLTQLTNLVPRILEAIIDVKEFPKPVKVKQIVIAVKGTVVACKRLTEREIFGYTILDSIRAIQTLSGADFYQVLGATTERALIFTNVSSGRSPMVAIRVQTLKPKAVVVHGVVDIDKLAIHLAELEKVPLIVSRASSVEALVDSLNAIYYNTAINDYGK